MMTDRPHTLLIGYGNPARADDGLGPAVARAIAERGLPHVTVEWPYHLQIEDAQTIAAHDYVIFVDADASAAAPFACRPVAAESGSSWTTHALAPAAALALAREVFDAAPPALLLGVRGYAFDVFEEMLSARAEENLAAAVAWLAPRLEDPAGRLFASTPDIPMTTP
jgi:hydrogenase maturation protease